MKRAKIFFYLFGEVYCGVFYYKYKTKLCSSSIVYISSVKEVKFNPLNFKDWCNIITKCNDISNEKTKTNTNSNTNSNTNNQNNTTLDIDISDFLLFNYQHPLSIG